MKKNLHFIAGIILGALIVCVPTSAYIVQDGDTLFKIAEKSNMSLSEVIELNDIDNPELILPGQEILTNQAYNLDLPFFQKLSATSEGLLGGNDINFVQVQNLYLSGSGISSTVSSIGLTDFKYPVNNLNVVMTDFGDIGYAVIEPDSSREENISFSGITQNADGSATITGVVRGLGLSYPYTASTTLASSHSGSSLLRISNTAPFYNEFNIKGKDETITGKWTFNVYPEYKDSVTATTSEQFITKRYADNLVNQGAATSTEVVAGISELATYQENASSTVWGILVPHVQQSQHSSSTPSANVATTNNGIWDIWSDNTGKLSQLWLDLTENFAFSGDNTFSGENSFSATTTMATTTIANLNLPYRYGDGSDGATTTPLFYEDKVWNFTSLTIPAGETSITTLSDTPIYVRVQGDCNIEGTLDVSGSGASGGALETGGATTTHAYFLQKTNLSGSGGLNANPPPSGASGYNIVGSKDIYNISTSTNDILFGGGFVAIPGSGGGGGGSIGSSVGGTGGAGGGSIVIYCGGDINFSGTITADGVDGQDATCNASDDATGGGGGAGGFAGLFGNFFLDNSGTITANGGTAGTKCDSGSASTDGADGIAISGSIQY